MIIQFTLQIERSPKTEVETVVVELGSEREHATGFRPNMGDTDGEEDDLV